MDGKMTLKRYALLGLALLLASCGGSLLEFPPGTQGILVTGLASTATQTAATVTWTTNVATTDLVEYGTASGTYTASTFQTQAADSSHTVSLSGLVESTTYYYRVRNFHATLADSVSAESSFATTSSTPPTLAQKQRGIWIVGGLSGSAISNTVGQVDLYDPVLDAWYASVTTLPTAVSFAAACSWGGRIYVFGGFNSSGFSVQNVQIYDVATGQWSAGANISAARANISAVVVSDKIYILGGTTADAGAGYANTALSYEYTPSLSGPGSWSTKTAMAAVGSERFLLPFDDVVYNMGGRTGTSALSATHDGLAVTSNPPNGYLTTVVEIALASARTGMCGVIYSPGTGPAVMAFVGGFTTVTGSLNFVAAGTSASVVLTPSTFNYLYYPFIPPLTLQAAAAGKNYPSLIGFGAAALYGSTMYVFGGTSSVTAGAASGLNDVNRFVDLNAIATTGTWMTCASMPVVGRYGHAAVTYRP
jgi:hypothetical protein